MRDASDKTLAVLSSAVRDCWYVADLVYDGQIVAQNVPLTRPRLRWDGSAQVSGSGSATVVWSDELGRSRVPEAPGDMFAPFGAELQVDAFVSAGVLVSERVPMGRFVIDSVPAATAALMTRAVGGLPISLGDRIEVSLRDLFRRTQRDRFPAPESPKSTSMWDEVQRLTGLAVERNVPDESVPLSLAYDEDRLNALDDLLAVADAVPHLTSAGAVTARPKAWPSAVDEFRGVAAAPRVLAADLVYNRVVVEGKSPTGVPLRAVAEVREGPLRVVNADGTPSPFGAATYFYQSDFLTTVTQCQTTARAMLARVSQLQSVTREVVEPLNPLREVGDVVLLGSVETRILAVEHDVSSTKSTVEVAP